MTYQETTEYLFTSAPLFQNVGKDAYKEGLYNTETLDEHFGHPHKKFLSVHIAGTNGKGSCSHTIASILQAAGYRVGLFTSPHLTDFRERIKVNGKMISEDYVVRFVEENRSFFEPLHPSFFELTTSMAFKYFAEQNVDIAVIEVGLGGRLDCTNIIRPLISIITNISFDHVALLGDTLPKIAREKAGIIKKGVPVVIGENNDETYPVFKQQSEIIGAPITFAENDKEIISYQLCTNGGIDYKTVSFGNLHSELGGIYQVKNANTILTAIKLLRQALPREISYTAIHNGFNNVCKSTGLMGRWQTINTHPLTICDTGHNVGCFIYLTKQLAPIISKTKANGATARIVLGMVNDKDVSGVLSMLPTEATYYFTQASVKRALPHNVMKEKAMSYNLHGDSYPTVQDAYLRACEDSNQDDFIFIGGSSFVVADLLTFVKKMYSKK